VLTARPLPSAVCRDGAPPPLWAACATASLPVVENLLPYIRSECSFVPVQYGLYSSFVGCFVYCLLGTAKDVTLGPTAIMSLLVSSYAFHDPAYAVLLAFLSGCIQLAMGLLHLGEMPVLCARVLEMCPAVAPSPVLSETLALCCCHSSQLRVHPVLPGSASRAFCATHPMQVSSWTLFPAQSLRALRRLLPSPSASTRSR